MAQHDVSELDLNPDDGVKLGEFSTGNYLVELWAHSDEEHYLRIFDMGPWGSAQWVLSVQAAWPAYDEVHGHELSSYDEDREEVLEDFAEAQRDWGDYDVQMLTQHDEAVEVS